MHIGRLSVHLWRGRFVVEDLVIEGLTPESRPFLAAKRIDVSMPWSTLFNRRVVFDAIEMTDWQMYVEMFPDGRAQLPALHAAAARAGRAPGRRRSAVRPRASRRVHLPGSRHAVEHRRAQPRCHRRPAGQRVSRPGQLLERHRQDPELRADARRHANDVPHRGRQGPAEPHRPADRRRRVSSSPAKWTWRAGPSRPTRSSRASTSRACARSSSPATPSRCTARAASTARSTCSARS